MRKQQPWIILLPALTLPTGYQVEEDFVEVLMQPVYFVFRGDTRRYLSDKRGQPRRYATYRQALVAASRSARMVQLNTQRRLAV